MDQLAELNDELEHTLPPTDARLRTDLRQLAQFNVKQAGKEKVQIEERERRKRREREAQGKKWAPQNFKKVPDDKFEYRWEYTGNYWEERSQRMQSHKDKQKYVTPSRRSTLLTIISREAEEKKLSEATHRLGLDQDVVVVNPTPAANGAELSA